MGNDNDTANQCRICVNYLLCVPLLPASKATVCGHKYDCHSEALFELVPGDGIKSLQLIGQLSVVGGECGG